MQETVDRGVTSRPEGGSGAQAIGRSVLAVLVGAVALIAVVGAISSAIYPLPPGLDVQDHEAMRQHVDTVLIGAFLLVLAAWAIGGSWVAARLATRARLAHGLVVGALFLLAGIMTMLTIPHPWWIWVGRILGLGGCSDLGARLAAAQTGITR